MQRQDLILGLPPSEKLVEKGFWETPTLILSADAALGRLCKMGTAKLPQAMGPGAMGGMGLSWGGGLLAHEGELDFYQAVG